MGTINWPTVCVLLFTEAANGGVLQITSKRVERHYMTRS